MLFGVSTAVCWGLADIGAALTGRRIGSLNALIMMQTAGLLALLFVAVVASPPWFAQPVVSLAALGAGVGLAIALVSFFRALVAGPLTIVAPIAAASAAVTAALSIPLLSERISGGSFVGGSAVLVGVALLSAGRQHRSVQLRDNGIALALIAMLGFGIGFFVIGWASQSTGWLEPSVLARVGSVATLLFLLRTTSWGKFEMLHVDWIASFSWVGVAALIGVLDALGVASYARGAEVGLLTIVAVASGAYPVLPVVAGRVLLKESLTYAQSMGVAVTIAGLVALGLAQR